MNESLIQSNFSRAADSYSLHAKVQLEIGKRLCQRFEYYKLMPSRVLDLGSGPGVFTHQLKSRFPKAHVVALDISHPMLKQIKRRLRRPISKIAGSINLLPFRDKSFDVIFANQVIHWASSFEVLFKEIHRVLKPSGVFVFSTLGPDTFKELATAWDGVDKHQHIYHFEDMHLLGDALLRSRFLEPVVDMEYLTVRYPNVKALARDLKAQGVNYAGTAIRKGLLTPRLWRKFELAYEAFRDSDKLLPLTYEVIYGQAWGSQVQLSSPSGEVIVPISQLKKKEN